MEYDLKELISSMWRHREARDFGRKDLETSYRGLSVKASIGMTGNLAKIPWVSYCAEGQETQKGIYPVLLFYGTPEFLQKNKNQSEVKKIVLAYGISANNQPSIQWGEQIKDKKKIEDLFIEWDYKTTDTRINKYNSSYVYKTYDWVDNMDYETIQEDIDRIIDIYLDIMKDVKNLFEESFTKSTFVSPILSLIKYRPYLTAIKSKPFLLLAGISGTGKSRIVRELARACWDEGSEEYKAQKPENFEMIQVKPNWHDSTELIGYVSRVSGKPVYVIGDFLRFVTKAWENLDIPYFLCLDEMNLAPVEQYFAEFLSVIESRKSDGKGHVTTDPILKKSTEDWYRVLTAELTGDNEALRTQFLEEGIALPQNLIVVGTVNMDETTFSFSRKVLDRAMTIEMNEVDLWGGLDYKYERIGKLSGDMLIGKAVEGVDVYADNKEVCDIALEYLKSVNEILDKTPFKVAYRTRNEFLLYVVNNLPYTIGEDGTEYSRENVIATALDEITSMKVLSRIEGDDTKVPNSLLAELKRVIREQLLKITGEDDQIESVSLAKLDEMQKRLKSGYTSFWS